MNTTFKKIISMGLVGTMALSLLTGCGKGNASQAEGSKGTPAITMDSGNIAMGEALSYTEVMKSQYESYYGTDIWDMEVSDGVTFGQSVKDVITGELVKMYYLSSIAGDYDAALSDEDKKNTDTYVENFKQNLGEDTLKANNISDDDIRNIITNSSLSNTVYQKIYNEVTATLTDEEKEAARCIKVQHILISTSDTTKEDENGDKVDMTDEEKTTYKEEQKALAEEVLQKVNDGEDFKALADEYTAENAGFEFAFDKNGYSYSQQSSLVEPFYTAAWELGEGEVSGLVETDYGYHIIKCISTNDDTETQQAITTAESNKKKTETDNKIAQMMEAVKYTEADDWKNYKIEATKVDESQSGAESGAETNAESTETSAETKAETQAETQAESETAAK